MRTSCIAAKPRKRFVVTTDSDHESPIAPNIKRMFRPNTTIRIMTRMVNGIVYRISTIRIMMESTRPPA